MFIVLVISAFSFIGILEARQPDIDINRIVLLPKDTEQTNEKLITQERYQFSSSNDYDDHGHFDLSSKLIPSTSIPIKIYQPREDPKLFYQSDAYLQTNGQIDEVSLIYPGNDVIRVEERRYNDRRKLLPLREKYREPVDDNHICVKCPNDRTLVAKPGSDRVLLQNPRLVSCSGRRPPRGARFVRVYGPKFGSLIEQGTHMVVGKVMFKNKNLHMCKMQVHVVVQGCATPSYLVSHCDDRHQTCNFTCGDHRYELSGPTSLMCVDDVMWSDDLPICKARYWCDPPQPPDHGHLNCKGATVGSGPGLTEGTRCRVKCEHGWRWSPRTVAVCRRGAWTNSLTCQHKRRG